MLVQVIHQFLTWKYQVCKIVEGQRYSKRLNEKQITALLKVTCQRPQEREKDILQVIVNYFYHFSANCCNIVAAKLPFDTCIYVFM